MHKRKDIKQSGFMVLIGMLLLVLGAGVWFGTITTLRSESMNIQIEDRHTRELQRIKEKMLTYAVMHPEIFRSDPATPLTIEADEDVPGIGYFPCPDTDGDGNVNTPCGGVGVVVDHGMVPESIMDRMFTFTDNPAIRDRYWYAVDSRFVTQNAGQVYDGAIRRYVPLNRSNPPTASLTLDGVADIVMVLIYSGDPLGQVLGVGQSHGDFSVPLTAINDNYLEGENADDDADFVSVVNNNPDQFNDYVIAITREEWNAAMLSRVSRDFITGNTAGTNPDQVADLCDVITAGNFSWFNNCSYVGAAPGYLDGAIVDTGTGAVPTVSTSDVLDRTCWQNTSGSGDENLMGQGWRTDLGC